jgi:hypothetical protein
MILYIADALNLSSAEAKARIAREINVRYNRVTSSIGLITSRRVEVTENTTVGDRFIEFEGIEKLDAVFYRDGSKNKILPELTHDEMLAYTIGTDKPTRFSVFNMKPNSVTIMLDCEPATVFPMYAHGLVESSTITGNDRPAFPESFHDVLIHGVIADEYRKMEKQQYARDAETDYERRLSDLKMFIAKSGYLDFYQGKHTKRKGWWDTGPR